jgi:CRISPR system Cascade subunit CasB
MSELSVREKTIRHFTGHLSRLYRRLQQQDSEARASLARLRRGLGRPTGSVPEVMKEVLPYLREAEGREEERLYGEEREAFFLVGSLFGLHPSEPGSYPNLGAVLHALADNPSAEARFVALLNARREALPDLLRQAVAMARAKDVPVNYGQLLRDVLEWEAEDRRVQLTWARSFWRPAPSSESNDPAAAAASENS